MTRVTVIYATPVAMPPIQFELAKFPELEVLSLLDEALLQSALDEGGVFARSKERMVRQLALAADAGSKAVLVTCNIYSVALQEIREQFDGIKILAVDESMVEIATTHFQRLAVIGTLQNGLDTQLELLRRAAQEHDRDVELVPILCEEAMTALSAGDGPRHDQLIRESMASLEDIGIEAVVLAQASMARALPLVASAPYPVLASPALAVAQLRQMIETK